MRKKAAIILAVTAALALGQTTAALAAQWQSDERGWKYQTDSGTYPANVMENIDGHTYLFGEDGYMKTGWQNFNGSWYYMNGDGHVVKGWLEDGGSRYYMSEYTGVMVTGWTTVGKDRYYIAADGKVQTGLFEVDGTWYRTNEKGALLQNKVTRDENGEIKTWMSDDGSVFRYNENDMSWEYVPSTDETVEMIMKKLFEELKLSEDELAFEANVRTNLQGLVSDEKIELYIIEAEKAYMFD